MKLFSLLLIAFAITHIGVAQDTMIREMFTVGADNSLSVSVGDADVVVKRGSDEQVRVEIVLSESSNAHARKYFDAQHFQVTQESNTVHITTETEKSSDKKGNWKKGRPQIIVHIHTPQSSNVKVNTLDGDVTIGDISGTVDLHTSDGDISANMLSGSRVSFQTRDGDISSNTINADGIYMSTFDGDIAAGMLYATSVALETLDGDISSSKTEARKITIDTSDGDIAASTLSGSSVSIGTLDGDITSGNIHADRIYIKTSDGGIRLGEITANMLIAETLDGDIRTSVLQGSAQLKTSDGDISLETVRGNHFSVQTLNGDVHIERLISDKSAIHTSDGTVTLSEVEGDLKIEGIDMDASLDLVNPGEISVSASSGDIALALPLDHGAEVNLSAESVHLSSYHAFTGRRGEDHAEGTINGGGQLINIRSTDGRIRLDSR